MGGGNAQVALALVTELLRNFLDAFHTAQYFTRLTNNNFTARCNTSEMFAAARENFQAQFVFQKTDLLGYSRLRGKQTLGSGGYVEIMVRNFPDIAQLL